MKTAMNTFVFDSCVASNDELAPCIELIGKTKFRYADLSMYDINNDNSAMTGDNWLAWAEGIGKAAARSNVTIIQAHSSDVLYDKNGDLTEHSVEMIKRQIEICRILGVPQTVVHTIHKPGNTWKQQRALNHEMYSKLTDAAERANVEILLENMCYNFYNGSDFYTSSEFLLATIADLGNHPLFNICWDTGHANMQGVDQYSEIKELGGRLKGLHVHDNLGKINTFDLHAAPFIGNCDFDGIIRALLEIGYGGYFTLESHATSMAKYIRRYAGGKLSDLPQELVVQASDLMYDITAYMLRQYGCFEE